MRKSFKQIAALMMILCFALSLNVVTAAAAENTAMIGPHDITIQPGTDETSVGVNWMIDGEPQNPVVQIARAEFLLLTNGAFPSAYAETIPATATKTGFSAVNAEGEIVYKYAVKATITGLAHLTEYIYRVGDDSGMTDYYRYKTPAKKNIRAMVLSDIHMIEHKEWGRDLFVSGIYWEESLQYYIDNYDFSLIMSMGDQFQNTTRSDYFDEFLSNENINSYPISVVNGNHDVSPASQNMLYYFNQTNMVEDTARYNMGDYFYKWGKALIVMMNISEAPEYNNINHRTVFERAIKAYPDYEWLIAGAHYPIYGTETTVADPTMESIYSSYESILSLLDEFKVDLYLNGHAHYYGRSYLIKEGKINEEEGAPDTYVDADGTVFVTLGAATEMWELFVSNVKCEGEWLKKDAIHIPTYQILDIFGNSLTLEAYNLKTHQLIDTLTLKKSSMDENDGMDEEAEPFSHPDLDEYYETHPKLPDDSSDSGNSSSTDSGNSEVHGGNSSNCGNCSGSASGAAIVAFGFMFAGFASLKKRHL